MERPDKLPVDYRLEHNRKIEAERKAWHRRKREESDEYREAYEFIDAQQKRIGDQMAKVFQSMNAVTNQMEQGTGAQPLKQEPDILSSFAIRMIPLMFLDTDAMQRALRRMALCKEIFDADQEFMSRMYPIS